MPSKRGETEYLIYCAGVAPINKFRRVTYMNIYIYRNEQQHGPYTVDQIRQFLSTGQINLEDYARKEEDVEWRLLRVVLEPPPPVFEPPIPPSLKLSPTLAVESKPQSSEKLATLALVFSGLSVTICLFFLAIPGVILGHMARTEAVKNGVKNTKATVSLVLGYSVLGIVLFTATVNSFLPKSPPDSSATSDTNNATASASADARPSSDNSTPTVEHHGSQIGDLVKVGDNTFQVTRREIRSSLGPNEYRTVPSPGAVFIVVYYSVTNNSNQTEVDWSDNDFMLKDSQDREFSPASKATTAIEMTDSEKDFMLSELQPGVTKPTCTAFEVPKDSADGALTFVISGGGIFGTKKKEISLQ
jgi:hypothetical protein